MGILRSFDQFANAVLEGACERVIVGDLYCDLPLGLYVIRGENVVLIGELDLEREELPPQMTRVSPAEIKRALQPRHWLRVATMVYMMMKMLSLGILYNLLFCCLCIEGSIHEYSGEGFVSKGNAFVFLGGSEGLYSSSSSSSSITANASEKNGDSYIRFEKITFRRRVEEAKSSSRLIQAIVFEVEDRDLIGGSAYGGQRDVCCRSDLAKLGVCKEGDVIVRKSKKNPYWPQVFGVSFNGDELVAELGPKDIRITQSEMYNLYFIHCDVKLKGLVIIEGKTIWKNPTGYLPGRVAPLMNFYGFMCIAFLVLGLFWFSQYARFWSEALQLQNCVSMVIGLVTLGTIKRTIARLVILIVSMGYGVVRSTLGGLTVKVMMLGGTFFLATEVLELVENVGTVDDLSGKARLLLVLPVAILDAFFIVWIFTSLSTTLNKLQAKRMTAKLDIYRKFTNSLAVAVIVSVAWFCYELYFKSNDIYNEQWRSAWIIPAFWHVLSFSLLCVICALWAASQNSMRYAYSNEGAEEFDNEDALTLIKPPQSPSKGVYNAEEEDTDLEISNADLEEDKRE
ncbi:hypothetical protein C5167_029049 [Papaver somniferum]|nr:hypothetical protein C5167_029049 [Papaver somniferum]